MLPAKSFDYHQLDAPDPNSGNGSDSDNFSELNSAKSERGGHRSSSLPTEKVSDIISLETILVSNNRSFEEIDNFLMVGERMSICMGIQCIDNIVLNKNLQLLEVINISSKNVCSKQGKCCVTLQTRWNRIK